MQYLTSQRLWRGPDPQVPRFEGPRPIRSLFLQCSSIRKTEDRVSVHLAEITSLGGSICSMVSKRLHTTSTKSHRLSTTSKPPGIEKRWGRGWFSSMKRFHMVS